MNLMKLSIIITLIAVTSLVYYQGFILAGSQYPIPSYIAYPLLSVFLLLIVLVVGSSKLDYLTKKIGCIKFIDKLVLSPVILIMITLTAQAFDLSTTYYTIVSGLAIERNLHVRTLIESNNIPIWIGEQILPTILVGALSILFISTKIRVVATVFLLTIFAIGLIAGVSNALVIFNAY